MPETKAARSRANGSLFRQSLVTFSDVDGDTVTVRTDRGTTPQLQAAMLLVPSGVLGGFQLQSVNLFDPAFNRTNLSITARPSATGGDGIVNVGEILSTFDLGTVSVGGIWDESSPETAPLPRRASDPFQARPSGC